MKWKRANETLWTCGQWSIEHMTQATRPTFELWLEVSEGKHRFVVAVDSLDEAKARAK